MTRTPNDKGAPTPRPHTPGPWCVEHEHPEGIAIYGTDGHIATAQYTGDADLTRGNAALIVRAVNEREELVATLRDVMDLKPHPNEGPSECFERLAEAFYSDTHVMAPGKSVPLEMGNQWSDEFRRDVWAGWIEAKWDRASAVLDRVTRNEPKQQPPTKE